MSLKRRRTGSFVYPSAPVPMQISYDPQVSGPRSMTTSRRRYNNSGRYRSRQSGPYRALTYGSRHTHPVYPVPEVKTIDLGADGQQVSGQPVVAPFVLLGNSFALNALEQGTTQFQRIGQSINVKSCAYRFELDLPTLPANQVPTSGRVMLIWDKQPSGATASFTTIFGGAGTSSYLSFISPSGFQRFIVLRNQQFSLSPNGDQVLFFEGFVRINMKTTFLTSQVPITIQTGALLLVYVGDQAATLNQPVIRGVWRVRFTDC